MLAGSSDYFKTAFGTHWNNNNNTTDNNNTEVTFTVQEDEIIAFKAILKFFYTSILPEDLMMCDLLKMFQLCDVLICNHLMQTIERRLVTACSGVIEDNDLISYFNLNVSIIDCTELNNKFQEVLVNRIGNLHIILLDWKDQDDFLFKLPLRGIISLFSYDRLLISHENEVLRLLIAWVTQTDRDTEDLTLLRECVRVCYLGMTIINEILQKQEWFEFTDEEKEITCAYSVHSKNVQIANGISKFHHILVFRNYKRRWFIESALSLFEPYRRDTFL